MNITLVSHKYDVPLNDPCIYPLGFMYVSSYFKHSGHNVKILNYNLWDYDFEGEIQGQDVVGFTGFEMFKTSILRDEKICMEHGVETMVGGALPTFNAIPEFLGFQKTGELVKDIDSIYPDYDGFEIREYHNRNKIKHIGILTSIGCPYHCTFCAQTCGFRMRSLDNVFKEIDYYKDKYEIDYVIFNDNTLNINRNRFMQICNGMG